MRWLGLLVCAATVSGAAPLVLEGALPEGAPDFVMIPFDVPAGIEEIAVAHPKQQPENILDYGLFDPSGFRGWGGGNDEPLVVGRLAASRSYLPGSVTPGRWSVLIGKAQVRSSPARYRLEIELRAAPTLTAQPQRTAYAPRRLSEGARWYAGDFHVHSRESGDAQPSLDAVATFARQRGLDFVELAEHNTVSQLELYADVQSRHPELLLLPGVEFTTYAGHANGIGATQYVDHRLGLGEVSLDSALAAFAAQDVVFSINHPLLDLGQACIGCAWKHRIPKEHLSAVEIATGGWDKTGLFFGQQTLAWWERLSNQGLHLAPIGGSDDHAGGQGTGAFDSPIGSPTTMVFAEALDPASIVAAVRAGHTVVKLQGPSDPMIDLRIGDHLVGDTVVAHAPPIVIEIKGGAGATLVVFKDGAELARVAVDADPFTWRDLASAGRYRAEAHVDGQPRTVTANLWVEQPTEPPPPAGCGCGADVSGAWGLFALWVARRRRERA